MRKYGNCQILTYLQFTFRSRLPPSSACSTCFCQICGEDSATATCYSCTSMYSDIGDYKQLKRTSSIKSISKIGDRTLAIIETDSDSSLGSFGSIDSPKTAWRKNQAPADKNKIKTADKNIPVNSRIGKQKDGSLDDDNDSDDDSNDEDLTDTNSITDSSVASVIEAVNRATDGHHGGSRNHESDRGEVIEGYFRNPTTSTAASAAATAAAANANGSIYGFTLRRKMAGSQSPAMNTGRPRPSFRQYNATVTSRQSRISVDSLTSPLSSLTLIGNQNKANSGSGNSSNNSSSNNIDSAMTTLSRNRGPRPAYSDANMQHSLGYLP